MTQGNVTQTCYKVVSNMDGELWSSTFSIHAIKYTPNQWVEPEFGKIFVYRDLRDSHNATCNYSEVWRCECVGLKEAHVICDPVREYDYEEFWEATIDFCHTIEAYNGTFFADKVKLIERIHP